MENITYGNNSTYFHYTYKFLKNNVDIDRD